MKMALRPTLLHNNKAIVFSKVCFKNFCAAKKLSINVLYYICSPVCFARKC